MADWYPKAKRQPYPSAGGFSAGGKKIVWHTTEGMSLPTYVGDAPHFTVLMRRNEVYQHVALSQASSSLEHPRGTAETNHAGCIQVELADFAGKSQDWPDAWYAQIAQLARWIEKNAGVPRRCTVRFAGSGMARRMSPAKFTRYSGHCGHEHAPNQPSGHWDPGAMRISKVLDAANAASSDKLKIWRAHLSVALAAERLVGRTKELVAYAARLRALIDKESKK